MIKFKEIRYQNILSTGNQFTTIKFDNTKSTLIIGDNGAGKSTIIEALIFVLFGRPYRNINKPQLVNSITNKNLLVEVDMVIGNKEYLVRRGMKPTVFELYQDGNFINQSSDSRDFQEHFEKNILKMNLKTCSQIAVLGYANYVPFMQLSAAERRKFIEDLLDIQIFSVMNSILKEKILDNKDSMSEVDNQIKLLDQRIEMHNDHLEKMKTNNDDLIAQKEIKIKEHQDSIALHRINVEGMMSQVDELSRKIADSGDVIKKKTNLIEMETKAESKIRRLKKEVQFYHDHDNCPTCLQGIDHDFKSSTLETKNAKIEEFSSVLSKIERQVIKTQERLGNIESINQQISKFNSAILSNNQQINFLNRYIDDLNIEIGRLQGNYVFLENDSNIDEYLKEMKLCREEKERLYKEKSIYDVSAVLLKDTGIKTKIVKQYIPVINKLISKYLASMDFFIDFQLDETFNEKIKSRHRDEFSYSSFSEGEKTRLDLALMFTWRAISRMRNSAACNLLIMDEIFDSSLDANGSTDLIDILNNIAPDNNIFVISHRGDQLVDKFDDTIKFQKHNNFSRML